MPHYLCTWVYFLVHDVTRCYMKCPDSRKDVTPPVRPAAPFCFPAVLLCQSTLSRLLTIMLLPEQFPNLLSETAPLMVKVCLHRLWVAEEDHDLCSPVEYPPSFLSCLALGWRSIISDVRMGISASCTLLMFTLASPSYCPAPTYYQISNHHWELLAKCDWYFIQFWGFRLQFPSGALNH